MLKATEIAILHFLAIIITISAAYVNRYSYLPGYAQTSSGGQDSAGDQQQQPANQENLCSLCHCTYLKAVCDFQQNKTLSNVWDSKYLLPNNIKSIEVYLKPYTEFRLMETFFQGNQVNYFGINGSGDNDLVEITPNAFSRNKGGYPNVEIRKATKVFLQGNSFAGNEYKLLFQDIGQLVVLPNAFTMTNLDCTFQQIRLIKIYEKAFSHGGAQNRINLRFIVSNMEELGRFDLSMSKVTFERCNIGIIGRNAFDVTKISELGFFGCNITKIMSHALTNKLNSENVSFVDSKIGSIEGEAISQSGITTLTLIGNTIDKIQSGAIQVTAVETTIANNTLPLVEPNWLNVVQASHVAIENNRFGIFSGFEVKSDPKSSLNCSFANNRLEQPQQGSLNFSRCDVHRNSVGRECSCNGKSWLRTLTDHDLDSEIICPLRAEEHSCFNATSADLRRFEHEACGGNETRHCSDGEWLTQSERDKLSGTAGPLSIKEISWIVLVVVGIACISIIIVKVSRGCGGGGGSGQARMNKCTFSEDSKRLLILSADKLSENDQTRKAINKLIKGSFTKDECLTRICEIVQHIPHKSSSIKDLLSSHLTECHESGTPMSSASGVGGVGDDYGMSAIGIGPAPSAPSAYECDNLDPIYQELDQEPDQQQRPLIPSEYAEPPPLDEVMYSEPFNATNANDMPPAYQYATPMRHPRPQPGPSSSTTACYASPVWRSTPSAIPTSRPPSGAGAGEGAASAPAPRHVRDLRQDLEAMPQFHPNQLTSARNQRQLQHNFPQPQPQAQAPAQHQPLPHPQPPPYSQPGPRRHRSRQHSFGCLDGAASLAAMEHMDSGSDHSGGSDVTVQIADVIAYADA